VGVVALVVPPARSLELRCTGRIGKELLSVRVESFGGSSVQACTWKIPVGTAQKRLRIFFSIKVETTGGASIVDGVPTTWVIERS
jgi:hypothetical protein